MASGAVVRAQYEEQLGWAVEEGVDFVIAETNDYVGEALIGLEVCQELGLPAMVTFASVQPTTTYDGYDYVEACRILADHGATVVGPQLLARARRRCCRCSSAIRAAVDVAGGGAAGALPDLAGDARRSSRCAAPTAGTLFPIELEPFQCTRFEMADFARRARDIGVDYIGICCGGGAAPRARDGRGARAARRRPAATRPPSSCIPCSGRGHRGPGHGRLERGGGLASGAC